MRSLLSANCLRLFFFFFQAEDGIRDSSVTGVQTCALPIFERISRVFVHHDARDALDGQLEAGHAAATAGVGALQPHHQIGRAPCRERVEISVVAGSLKKKKEEERCLPIRDKTKDKTAKEVQ